MVRPAPPAAERPAAAAPPPFPAAERAAAAKAAALNEARLRRELRGDPSRGGVGGWVSRWVGGGLGARRMGRGDNYSKEHLHES